MLVPPSVFPPPPCHARNAKGTARVVVPMRGTSLDFLRGWSRDPVAVGLPFTSSPWTARRLAQETLAAAIPGDGLPAERPIVELGAGTGAITAALLEAGCPPGGLVVVERDADLCATLRQRFPGLRVLHGDALELRRVLGSAGISSVSAVLSGLPMRAIPDEAATRCYAQAFALMPPGGAIVQYTYGLRPPVDPDEAGLPLDATFLGREWRNVLPIGIWLYRLMQAVPARPAAKNLEPGLTGSAGIC